MVIGMRQGTKLVVLGIAAAFAVLVCIAPAHATFTSCTYDAAARAVDADVDATASNGDRMEREDGAILATLAGGFAQCGEATIANTDTVTVDNVTPSGAFSPSYDLNLPLDLMGGATDEPGDSDEIEITVNLGSGVDGFTLKPGPDTPTAVPSAIAIGEAGGQAQVNVNAAETDGVDNDVFVHGADFLAFDTGSGDDEVSAEGAGPDAPDPVSLGIFVETNQGDDSVVGGSAGDVVRPGIGADEVDGGPGDDLIEAQIGRDVVVGGGGSDSLGGGTGNDELKGGGGDDVIRDRGGNDRLIGGPGEDTCVDHEGRDRFRGCEVVRD